MVSAAPGVAPAMPPVVADSLTAVVAWPPVAESATAIDRLPPVVVLFHVAVAVLVAFAVVGHVIIALLDRRTAEDERDRLIALKGARIGSFVLAVGVFFALWLAVASTGNFWFTQVLLGFWVLAQLSDYSVQLKLQRQGG